MENYKLLEVKELKQYFPIKGKKDSFVRAVDGVNFFVNKGETFGLVGESGCGKSTVARSIMRIYEPTSGDVILDGENITKLTKKQLMPHRKKIQMVFQDPYSSLNSRMSIRDILLEPLIGNNIGKSSDRVDMVIEALKRVNLPTDAINRYPHEFSGGQRQRIGIARALIVKPKVLICDEAISALDVSIQAQVINMLRDFQNEMDLTYLFIAHDLSMVRYVSHRVGVMYLGRLVEVCTSEEIYENPIHPYTKGLLAAVPIANPNITKTKERIEGEVPSPINPPSGCYFHPRCPHTKDICKTTPPTLKDKGDGHFVSCHLFD